MKYLQKIIFLIITILILFSCKQETNKVDLLNEGNKYYNNNEFSKAKRKYLESIEKDSSYFKSHLNKSHTLYKENNLSDAIKSYRNSLIYAPTIKDSSIVEFNLANALLKKGADSLRTTQSKLNNEQELLRMYTENQDTIEEKKQKSKIQSIVDTIKNYKKLIKESIELYKKCLLTDPNNTNARINLAIAQSFIDKEDRENEENEENKEENQDENQDEQESDAEIKQNLLKYLNDVSDANLSKDTIKTIDNDDW